MHITTTFFNANGHYQCRNGLSKYYITKCAILQIWPEFKKHRQFVGIAIRDGS